MKVKFYCYLVLRISELVVHCYRCY